MLSLKWCAAPDYDNRFIRTTLTIEDSLAIVEMIIVDIHQQSVATPTNHRGYLVQVFGGYPPTSFFSRFKKHNISSVDRGVVKHWSGRNSYRQIYFNEIREGDIGLVLVLVSVRLSDVLTREYQYEVKREDNNWIVIARQLLREIKHGG